MVEVFISRTFLTAGCPLEPVNPSEARPRLAFSARRLTANTAERILDRRALPRTEEAPSENRPLTVFI